MTLKSIIELWIAEKRRQVKESSMATYINSIDNYILPDFGEFETISEKDVQDWIYKKNEDGKLSGKTVRDIIIALKMILKFGSKNKLIEYDGFDLNFPQNKKKAKIETLSEDGYNTLTKFLNENFTFKNLGLQIAIQTGMRIGEICSLKWSDIDIERGIFVVGRTVQRIYYYDKEKGKKATKIIIGDTKTHNSDRHIPISNSLLGKLKRLKEIANNDFYVVSNNCKPMEPRVYRNYYLEVSKKVDIPKMKFHGLRHTFATKCIASGADVKTVSVLLGHANVSITLNTYVHPSDEQKRNTINAIFDN